MILFLALSIFTSIVMFTFPPFVRMGSPYNIELPFLITLVIIYIYWYSINDKAPDPLEDMKFLDEVPNGNQIRKIVHLFCILMAHIGFFWSWYANIWDMSTPYWIILYIHNVLTVGILYKLKKAKIYE